MRSQQVSAEPKRVGTTKQPLAQVIHAANELVPVLAGQDEAPTDLMGAACVVVEQVLGLNEENWTKVAGDILDEHRQIAEMFDIRLESQAAAMDLCAEAQEEATHVGMVAQLERTKAVQDNEDLLRRATTDPLTGIANRAKFDDRLEQELKGLRRGHGDFALVMLDIDYFKKFNDTHGHQVGDLVLKRVATTIRNTLRDVDLLARYGGEEFVILTPHNDRKGACIVAARVQRCVEELKLDVNGTRLGVTISSGVAITTDYDAIPEADKLIADADAQLYISKEAGRNTWSYLGRSASKLQAPNVPAAV